MNKQDYIGGAFSLLDTDGFLSEQEGDFPDFFPEEINGSKRLLLETGVDALAFISKEIARKKNIKEIYFPLHYCQDSIDRFLLKSGDSVVKRYDQAEDLKNTGGAAIVVWNHLNRYQPVPSFLQTDSFLIVEDFVQAPFEMKKAVTSYSLNSLRKVGNIELSVCYVPEPATDQLSAGVSSYYLLKKKAEVTKHYFKITGEAALEKKFLGEFKESEEYMNLPTHDNAAIRSGTAAEEAKFRHANFGAMLQLRKDNYAYLHRRISQNFNVLAGEYMYLMLATPERDRLRDFLAQHGVFTTIHWIDSCDKEKSDTLLSLYIDQRYTTNHMEHVAELLLSF